MTNPATNAPFITLEGGEGTGKSTQIKLLSAWLSDNDVEHVCTREPGGAPGAEEIRTMVLTGDVDRWTPMTEVLLYTASRSDHVERVIVPSIESGKWVLCDRFADSSVAYQGAGRGAGVQRVKDLQRLVLGDLKPDLTLILDIPIEVGLKRAMSREGDKAVKEDRIERMGKSLHEQSRDVFMQIAAEEPERCVVVNANKSIDELQQDLRTIITNRFGPVG